MSNKWMLGVIDATAYMEPLQPLVLHRSVAAVPFAGRYRLIDFVLSSMVNSGIESVAIFPKYQYRSLMDHLGSGKNWDLNRKRDGLFFFPSPDLSISAHHVGAFAHFEQHIDYFLRSRQEYTIICHSHTVCNIDYEAVLERHIANGCDITEIRYQGRSLEMYVLETSLLLDLIANYKQTGYCSIVDVVRDYRHSYKICTYEHNGYAAVIDSVESYFRHSMELLNRDIWRQLFLPERPIYTKVKDEPPTKYTEKAVVKNSMIANGCIIEGHVENSIIFRSVKIGKGAVIKNSIIMQKSQIGEQCYLDSVIVDKDAKIENGVSLRGTERHPFVIRKGTVQGELMNR
ncbi:glucose-1-phosphate adenylyltransferase, GlgD subunit [Parageobacillus genomosp. 1]|uniref:Glucose-1-phosphate adenylyltransferase, GlgD subunit n=1 Tax=Parageobacillus genomosp. 1 TaxID=1295642 RepID=A0ABC9VE59_9BACL|nr:glucose-1-phosphate adenylyltransferase subunit GlgD [Parageobacillus genomosp. 1]EZP76584.1 glucose-1-phosphate adenylyltransferase, GlgD subunit [Parageobacillus genomosp. 1]